MIKEIFVLRHGETDFNKQGLVQGSGIDAPLNDLGFAQSDAFFEKYSKTTFDKIYLSGLRRTHETILPFIEMGIPYERHDGLNEINWGDFEGKVVNNGSRSYYKNLIDNWKMGNIEQSIKGGESPADVARRQRPFIDLMYDRKEENRILICMHGRAMRVIMCQLLNRPLSEMEEFHHHNTGLYVLKANYLERRAEVVLQNCTAHLESVNIIQ